MMTSNNAIADDEILYRSVRAEEIDVADGKIVRLSSQAFNDRSGAISFDRAKLTTAEQTRKNSTDLVLGITARDARAIQSVTHNNIRYQIEVLPAPLPDNPAHAIARGIPPLEGSGFKKLKTALAGLKGKAQLL